MPRPNTSQVTEDEVKALFGTDGDIETEETEIEEAVEEEAEEIEASEEEESQDEDGEESDDSEESEEETEEEPTELDWSRTPEPYRKAFEERAKESERWQKAHSKLQSELTRRGQAQREEERTISGLRQRAQVLDQWEATFRQYPEFQRAVEREYAKLHNPVADVNIPDHVKNDPAFQAAQSMFGPQIQRLQAELRKNNQLAEKVQGWEAQQKEAANKARLDGLLGEAQAEFKSKIGRNPTQDEMGQVLQFMVENNYYGNGKLPVRAVFEDMYGKAAEMKRSALFKEKAKKFAPKNRSINSSRGRRSEDAATPEEAVAMALADQGYGRN